MSTDLVPLSIHKIDSIFDSAITQTDYILELFKYVHKDWERIRSLTESPKTSEDLATYVMGRAIRFDKMVHPDLMPGGAWMNWGFGVDNNITGWVVRPAESEYK